MVSDSFVPEADETETEEEERALEYPKRMPLEASEADVLEQEQELPDDEDDR